jgi:DNA mismatch endonuclease (patch repair protein)
MPFGRARLHETSPALRTLVVGSRCHVKTVTEASKLQARWRPIAGTGNLGCRVPDKLTPEQRSRLMARVRTRNTAPELELRRALYTAGVRGWRLHRPLPGKPDLVFGKARVCVFVDGAFWHGHPDYYRGQSGEFWDRKIALNRARDQRVNRELSELGWTVVRVWDFEVERQLADCVARIRTALAGSEPSARETA